MEYGKEYCRQESVFDSSCQEDSGDGPSRNYDEIQVFTYIYLTLNVDFYLTRVFWRIGKVECLFPRSMFGKTEIMSFQMTRYFQRTREARFNWLYW